MSSFYPKSIRVGVFLIMCCLYTTVRGVYPICVPGFLANDPNSVEIYGTWYSRVKGEALAMLDVAMLCMNSK